MDSGLSAVIHQAKLERSTTRWKPSIDKIFADLVVKHIQLVKEQITFSCYKVLVVGKMELQCEDGTFDEKIVAEILNVIVKY